MAFLPDGFCDTVALPPGLALDHLRPAVLEIEASATSFLDLYKEQKNLFSAFVGILGKQALHAHSPYKRCGVVGDVNFPDLSLGGAPSPRPDEMLESRATATRSKQLQAHYDHAGWYIVWRYDFLEEQSRISVREVDLALLSKTDWTYQPTRAREGQGGRTPTFSVKSPSQRFANTVVYRRP